jgi:hypothetical protein
MLKPSVIAREHRCRKQGKFGAAKRVADIRCLVSWRSDQAWSSRRWSALAFCPLSLSRRLHCLLNRRSRTTPLTMRIWRAMWPAKTATLFCGGWRRFFLSAAQGRLPYHVSVGPRTDKGKSVTGTAASWRCPCAGAVCLRRHETWRVFDKTFASPRPCGETWKAFQTGGYSAAGEEVFGVEVATASAVLPA